MVELRGMTIKELNDVLDDMHSVYPFQNDKTIFGSIRDIMNMTPNNVEIITTDEKTGVQMNYHDRCYRKWFLQYHAV